MLHFYHDEAIRKKRKKGLKKGEVWQEEEAKEEKDEKDVKRRKRGPRTVARLSIGCTGRYHNNTARVNFQ